MKIQKSRIKNLRGFSLVELLVVITIIAILSVVAYTAIGGQTIKAKNSRRLQDTNTIQQALELYFVKHSSYPVDLADMGKGIISKIPQDPVTKANYTYCRTDQACQTEATGNQSAKAYILGATLEEEDLSIPQKAYMVGNSDDYDIVGYTASGSGCNLIETNPESTTCFPYLFP